MTRIRPNIADWFDRGVFPAELVPELGELGVLGMTLEGYGCPGRTAVEYGLAALELEAGDSGIRTFVSVQGSLAMGSIHRWGTEEQKQEWLPRMARGEVIGCFGLTEPGCRLRPVEHEDVRPPRRRRLDPDRIEALDRARHRSRRSRSSGRRPTTACAGSSCRPIRPDSTRRCSSRRARCGRRSSASCTSTTSGCRHRALLPGARGLRGPFAALNEARYGIIWGSLGAARDSYEAALRHALRREQFDRPIAGFQLTQQKLVDMVLELQKGALLALHIGRLKDAGTLTPTQISLGKLNNVREAIAIAREARTILGGDGVLLENSPIRHAANLESVRTYEGTDEVHTLILGQHLTRISAFR